ncbi:AAA family ATPase [Dactylosporangium sp. NPDC005572]|uniref:AAA family ATPase n=1 Tax=Dactylosporangium sp. NPDC005572 TaxID=3156889 RepID=UPI0033BCB889
MLLASAIIEYPAVPDWNVPELVAELQQVVALFTGQFGYTRWPTPDMSPTREELRDAIRSFAMSPQRSPDEYVTLYLAGHGELLDDGEHVLLPADCDPADVRFHSVRTADIAEWMLADTRVRRLMILLDTCYSGNGGAALLRTASRFNGQVGGLVIVTSTRPDQLAVPGVFASAFANAVEHKASAGFVPPVVMIDAVVELMKEDPQLPASQRVGYFQQGTGEDVWFLPNLRYDRALDDLDVLLQEQYRQQRRRREELGNRFVPATQWFTGRDNALRRLHEWLCQPDGRSDALVVTGNPGSGKTAVLGLLTALSDPDYRRSFDPDDLPFVTLMAPGAIDVSIYAGTLPVEGVLAALAAAANVHAETVTDLLRSLQSRQRPLLVLIDALDEASDPQQLVQRLLRPLIDYGEGNIRLLLGTRAHLLGPIGTDVDLINLDDPEYADPASVRLYAERALLRSFADTPYHRAPPAVITGVADAIAAAADTSFLVARILAQTEAQAAAVADPADAGWRAGLPSKAGDAMRRDLDQRLRHDAGRARALLLPLAYAQGSGLPWETIWRRLANALSPGQDFGNDDLLWLRTVAGAYMVETASGDRSAYRLYHQSLVEHLRESRDDARDHAAIAEALIAHSRRLPDGTRDWAGSHPYIRSSLASHAAFGGVLDRLLHEPMFLMAASTPAMLAALPYAVSHQGQAAADAYRRTVPYLRERRSLAEFLAYLELAAVCGRAPMLAERIRELGWERPWSARWSSWQPIHPHRRLPAGEQVSEATVADINGRPVVVAIVDGEVGRWDLITGSRLPGLESRAERAPMAVSEWHGRAIGCFIDDDGRIVSRDLDTGTQLWQPVGDKIRGSLIGLVRAQGTVLAVTAEYNTTIVWDLRIGRRLSRLQRRAEPRSVCAITTADGVVLVVVADGRVRYWDVAADREIAYLNDPDSPNLHAMCAMVTTVGDQVVVVSGTDEGQIQIWHASSGQLMQAFHAHTGPVTTLQPLHLQAGNACVSGGADGSVQMWDLTTGRRVVFIPDAESGGVESLAVAGLDGWPQVVTTGWRSGAIRVWDLAVGPPPNPPFRLSRGRGTAMATVVLDGRQTVVVGNHDATVELWDLRTGMQHGVSYTGHRAPVEAVTTTHLGAQPMVITADYDGTVHVWDPASATPLCTSVQHSGPVHAVAAVVDGDTTIAMSAGADATIRIWDLRTGAAFGEPCLGHRASVLALAAARSGVRRLLAAGDASGAVIVWDLSTRAPVTRLPRAHHGWVRAVCLTRLDHIDVVVSAGDDGTVHAWQVDTGEPVGAPIGALGTWIGTMSAVATPNRTLVVTGDGDGRVHRHDLANGPLAGSAMTGHAGWVRAVATLLVDDDSPVAVSTADDRALFVWDLATWTRTAGPSDGHRAAVTELLAAESAGGPVVLSTDLAKTVHGWNATYGTGVVLHRRVALDANDRLATGVLSGGPAVLVRDDWRSRCFDPFTGWPIGEFVSLAGYRTVAIGTAGGRDLLVATGEWSSYVGRLLDVWNLGTGQQTQILSGSFVPDPETLLLAETADGRPCVVAGYFDGTIRIWPVDDDAGPRTEATAHVLVHTQAVRHLASVGQLLLTICNQEVCVWDLETLTHHGRRRRRRPTPHWRLRFAGTIGAAALSGTGGNLLVGLDSIVRVCRGADITDIDLGCDVTALAWIGTNAFAAGTTQGLVTIDLKY